MTDLTEDELYVLTVAEVDHLGEFDSMDAFKEVMEMAQQGGKSDDPIENSVPTDFQFNGDFEEVVNGLVNTGLINVSEGSYKISDDGVEVYRHNQQDVPMGKFNAILFAKSLYNE